MLSIAAFLTFIVSLALIAGIIGRKMPVLREIKLEEIDREKDKKRSLLEERLKRKFRVLVDKAVASGFGPRRAATVGKRAKEYYQFLQDKKLGYWKAFKKIRKKSEWSAENGQNEELRKAEELINERKFDEAEKAALHIIKEDPKSLFAYKLLAKIYLESKNFLHAEATWEHVVKLANRLKNVSASHYLELAETKLKLEKLEDALQNAKKAVTLEPSNPRVLHFIIKTCILLKQKDLGWKYYLKLKKINPENEGLDELLYALKSIG